MNYEEPNLQIIMFDETMISTLGGSDDEPSYDWEEIPNQTQL